MSSVTAAMSSRGNLCLPQPPSPQTVCFFVCVVFFSSLLSRLPAHAESVCLLHSLSSRAPFDLSLCQLPSPLPLPPPLLPGHILIHVESESIRHAKDRCPHLPVSGALDTCSFHFLLGQRLGAAQAVAAAARMSYCGVKKRKGKKKSPSKQTIAEAALGGEQRGRANGSAWC